MIIMVSTTTRNSTHPMNPTVHDCVTWCNWVYACSPSQLNFDPKRPLRAHSLYKQVSEICTNKHESWTASNDDVKWPTQISGLLLGDPWRRISESKWRARAGSGYRPLPHSDRPTDSLTPRLSMVIIVFMIIVQLNCVVDRVTNSATCWEYKICVNYRDHRHVWLKSYAFN